MEDKAIGKYIAHQSRLLGRGKFGSVFIATKPPEKSIFAVRKIDYTFKNIHKDSVKSLREELRDLKTLERQMNLVKYYDAVDDGQALWLVSEYCDSDLGDLEQYLMQHQQIPDEQTKLHLMLQCTRGVNFLHNQSPPIVHGDIKLKNFLVKLEQNKQVVKLTDYGFVKLLKTDFESGYASCLSFLGTTTSTPFFAPEQYDADETLWYKKSTVDIFALGLVFQVLLGYPEFSSSFQPQTVDYDNKMAVGMQICFAVKHKIPIPKITRIVNCDTADVRKIKQLIIDMTHQDGDQRKELRLVQQELEKLLPLEYEVETTYDSGDAGAEIEEHAEQKEVTEKMSMESKYQTDVTDQMNDVPVEQRNDTVSDLAAQLPNLKISELSEKMSMESKYQNNVKDGTNDVSVKKTTDTDLAAQLPILKTPVKEEATDEILMKLTYKKNDKDLKNEVLKDHDNELAAVPSNLNTSENKTMELKQIPVTEDVKPDEAVAEILRTGIGPGIVTNRLTMLQQPEQSKDFSTENKTMESKQIPVTEDVKSDEAVAEILRTGIGPGVVTNRLTMFQQPEQSKDLPAESIPLQQQQQQQDQSEAKAAFFRSGLSNETARNFKKMMEMWNKKQ